MTTRSSTIEYTFLPPRGPLVTSFFKLTICLNSGAGVHRERHKFIYKYIFIVYFCVQGIFI